MAEVEVESVAYIVCDALGLDSSHYSFAYVARWSDGVTEVIKDTAEDVIRLRQADVGGHGDRGALEGRNMKGATDEHNGFLGRMDYVSAR